MPRVRGRVDFYRHDLGDRGYGFLWLAGSTERVFVAARDLDGHHLCKGDYVEFDVVRGIAGKGPVAQNIQLIFSSTMGAFR